MGTKSTILLVDHNDQSRLEKSKALKSIGYRVEETLTTSSLFQAVNCRQHDLILLNADLPRLNPSQALKKIQSKADLSFGCLPGIIFFHSSSNTGAATVEDFFHLGNRDMLVKCCSNQEVVHAVKEMIHHRRSEKANLENGVYRQLVHNLHEGIWVIDTEGKTTFMNHRMAEMLGVSRAEVLGRSLFSFMDEQGVAICRQNMKRRELGIREDHDFELIRQDGTRIHTIMQTSPLNDSEGKYIGAMAGVLDITERKEAELDLRKIHDDLVHRSRLQPAVGLVSETPRDAEIEVLKQTETLFRQLIESTPDAMVVTDHEGTIILVNAVTEKMFGYTRHEMLGQPTEMLIPDGMRQVHQENVRQFGERPRPTPTGRGIKMKGLRKDGLVFPAEISLGPITTENGLLVICTITDLTRWLETQNQIQANLDAQQVIGDILRLSLEPLSMEEFLQASLEMLVALPWFEVQSKGAIFLVNEEQESLVLTANVKLPESLLTTCARVPFGHCLCGKAAETRAIVYSSDVDSRHQTKYDGMHSHGHYCIPILMDEKLTGVINLYLETGHEDGVSERNFLTLVADALAGAISRKKSEADLLSKESQLLAAQSIQEHILPHCPPEVPGFEIAGAYHPAEFAAGDHYDHFIMPDGSLCIGVGDVSGHGFSSALLMASTHAYIHALAGTNLPITEIFQTANENLFRETDSCQFITAILGRIDPATCELTYVSAGHPSGYVFDRDGEVKATLKSTGIPLAVLPDAEYSLGKSVTLQPGDIVLMITDGILEAQSPAGEFFDEDRVTDLVKKLRGESAESILSSLIEAVQNFHGNTVHDDDITAVAIKVVGQIKSRLTAHK